MKIAVYGASGYQGKLVLAQLAGRGLDAALVGRDPVRLAEAADAVGLGHAGRRVAAIDDHGALVRAFGDCDAVVNCAGPFTPSGTAVIRAALAAGAHYTDTAGEQLYVKEVFDTLGAEAEDAGVTVVPAATDSCLPLDLLAHLVAEWLGGPVEELASTHVIVLGGGGMSRGSLRTAAGTIDTFKSGGLHYHDGEWSGGTAARRTAVTLPGETEPTPVMKFAMSEIVTIPRHVRVRYAEGLADVALGAQFDTLPTPEMIDGLPEGPTEDGRRAQSFTYVVDAAGTDGRCARGVLRGSDAYGTTAVIAAEAARRLATGAAKPGVLAASEAYDPAGFLDWLAPHGVRWTVEGS